MKFLKENWANLLTIVLLIAAGILLLVNPSSFGLIIIQAVGVVLFIYGIVNIVKYFKASPEEAAKGYTFSTGAILISSGAFCFFSSGWFKDTFPILAVLYGLFQILIGFIKLQRTVDALRAKDSLWYMRAISTVMSLLFGLLIVMNPDMTMMSIWVFTGITLIIEGVFDAVTLYLQEKEKNKAHAPQAHAPQAEAPAAWQEAAGAEAPAAASESPASRPETAQANAPAPRPETAQADAPAPRPSAANDAASESPAAEPNVE